MITIDQKKEIVADLISSFTNTSGYYLVDFMGMTVEASIHFRRELKKKGLVYKIAKNTLIKKALTEAGLGDKIPDEKFFGASGVVFCYDDPTTAAKIIKESFDKSEKPTLKAAVIEGVFYDGKQLKAIAALPSKPDIIAGIVGSLHAPISEVGS